MVVTDLIHVKLRLMTNRALISYGAYMLRGRYKPSGTPRHLKSGWKTICNIVK